MQGAIARVCMVVVAAILNNPLLFPRENTTIPEQDDELIARMQEHEERLKMEQAKLEEELSRLNLKQDERSSHESSSQHSYGWYFWYAVSLVIFLTIEVCRVDLACQGIDNDNVFTESGSISSRTLMLDKSVLSNFCDRCNYISTHESWRVREFAEGFADDLLESLRSLCNREVDMEVGDFVGVGSMFESWKVSKPLTCDLIVPFSPPEPYSFQFQLWCSPSGDIPPGMQGCGKIRVTGFWETGEGCLCGSTNLGEDMLCLLHNKNERPRVDFNSSELLCSKNTSYLAKDQVMKWFQISLTKAWGRISHKYEFELTFHNLDAAGALKVRFRSGKVIVMNIIPVVQLEDTDAYFVSHFSSESNISPDPYWALSFAVYERNLLKLFAKSLPENSCHLHCLQIMTFLHRKQTGLTGKSALTNYHFKTALLHLLISKSPSCWGIESIEHRLCDVLDFLQRSLQEKRLHHVLVGNSQVPADIQVPEIFLKSEPINLFRPLVLQRELYRDTVTHFQEMLRNASVLIKEYTPRFPNGDAFHRLGQSF
ncbi:inositol 1,4,5-trisphosphate receptor-interacting protein [Lampris incognitus]|uniref:inositol 1,4,5-trisphosphate receptor-interacting protein n=1 Tax=Lampris incognitus TaxID=2546036 RepID=UPI0024B5A85B|nr:inositol 1,4,5-trisphosphate receptor-interacting protein [Lampris incognitus]XP_056147767.1 inositol 1,4,5-trisphosphate receptor-interacting protein [Lampris incognitus]